MSKKSEDDRRGLEEGEVVGVYRIERLLGSGGFGLTYLARDQYLDRLSVLKEFMPLEISHRDRDGRVGAFGPRHETTFARGLKRFLTEARLLGRVDHPNVARVLSAFEMNETGYMAMSYESGRALDKELRGGHGMSESRLKALAFGLLDALDTIHAAGIIHRDIKPSNVLIARDGRPVLLDFGSATRVRGDRCDAGISTISSGYSPIELYEPERYPQGPWTDIYGVAAILYRIITGVRPAPPVEFRSGRDASATESGVFSRFSGSAASAGAGDYSESFLKAVDHALESDPELRPECTRAWCHELVGQTEDDSPPAEGIFKRIRGRVGPLNDFAALRDESNGVLLARARRLLSSRPLSDSKREKTMKCCRRVLTSDPTHEEARKITKRLVFETLTEARIALNRGAADRARKLLEFAESVFPGDNNVAHLRSMLTTRYAGAKTSGSGNQSGRDTSAA